MSTMSRESRTTEKEFIQALMLLSRVERRDISERNGPRTSVAHNVSRCSKARLSLESKLVKRLQDKENLRPFIELFCKIKL